MNCVSSINNRTIQSESFRNKSENNSRSATTTFKSNIQSDCFHNRTSVSSAPAFKAGFLGKLGKKATEKPVKVDSKLIKKAIEKVGKGGISTLAGDIELVIYKQGKGYSFDFTVPAETARAKNFLGLNDKGIEPNVIAIEGTMKTQSEGLLDGQTLNSVVAKFRKVDQETGNVMPSTQEDTITGISDESYAETLTKFLKEIVGGK